MRWSPNWKGTAKRDTDLERELLSDLELEEEEQRERGLSAEEARSAARCAFGNTTLIREQTRAVWSWVWMEHLARDVKYGTRTLLRSPEFAIVSILVMALGIGATIASGAARPHGFEDMAAMRRLPGVRGAALVSAAPGSGPQGGRVFTILEKPAPSYAIQYVATTLTADPQYFSVMQIPLLRGRVFTEHERLDNDHYIVVSKQFVDQFFSGDNPIGKHVRVDWDDIGEIYEIIGEVGDTIYDVTKPVEATIYFPILSGIPDYTSEATIVAWTSVDPLAISTPIQQQISALEPELPVYKWMYAD